MKKNEFLTIPNAVTVLHILLLPILYIFIKNEQWLEAGFLFLFTGFLDLLDGFLARLLKQFSELGKILDPIADKLGNIIVLIFLLDLTGNITYKIVFGIFLSIELFLGFATGYVIFKRETKKFQITVLGKISMFIFFLMLNAFIFNLKFQSQIGYMILFCLAILLAPVRLYCLTRYILDFFKK